MTTRWKTMNGRLGAYNHGAWSLPHDGQHGKWMPAVEPRLCKSGYHCCSDPFDLLGRDGRTQARSPGRGRSASASCLGANATPSPGRTPTRLPWWRRAGGDSHRPRSLCR
jgi:hypothetical protein